MYLNTFAQSLDPIDMTGTEEFASLLQSARDLGIPYTLPVRYTSRNLVVNGLRLQTLEWGDPAAPPVLVLHGGNQTSHSWDLVSLVLAPRYHVVAIDQRGHGDSEWPRDGEISTEAMADDAFQVIQTLGLVNPLVMGHSMGGQNTLRLLLEHPGVARRAVIVDIGPEVSREGTAVIQAFIRDTREFDTVEEYIERVATYDVFRTREHITRTAKYNILRRPDGKLVSKHDLRRRATETATVRESARVTLAEVKAIALPVLVVRGGQSNVLAPEAAARFVQALPQGRLVTVPNCGHNVHSQNTPGFLDVVVPFLDEA
jgi:pimeloyl-ACP methyl ester carboxylesterase